MKSKGLPNSQIKESFLAKKKKNYREKAKDMIFKKKKSFKNCSLAFKIK